MKTRILILATAALAINACNNLTPAQNAALFQTANDTLRSVVASKYPATYPAPTTGKTTAPTR